MLKVVLRSISQEVVSIRHGLNCQNLRCYAREVPASTKALPVEDITTQPVTETVLVPVATAPTLDASLRTAMDNTGEGLSKRKTTGKIIDEQVAWLPSPTVSNYLHLMSQYKKLSKFRLTSLVVITTMGGYAMAPGAFELSSFLMCSLGTGLVSAAANAINQYHEVPFDSQMSRTKNRVLVTGQLTPLHGYGFAIASATAGLSMLYFGVNGLTAALAASNLILYTAVYTPMKRISILNTWIGSVVGAIPPLMGWAGCVGTLDAGAWILAGVLYAWQFPHFNALSWNLRPDYSRAGYRMMAVTNPDLCRRTALRYTFAITGLSCLAPLFDVTNNWFALEVFPLNAYFCFLAYKFYKRSDSSSSRKLFRFSLLHLPALMLFFLLNKKHWLLTDAPESADNLITREKSNAEDAMKIIDNASIVLKKPTVNDFSKVLQIASVEAIDTGAPASSTKAL